MTKHRKRVLLRRKTARRTRKRRKRRRMMTNLIKKTRAKAVLLRRLSDKQGNLNIYFVSTTQ